MKKIYALLLGLLLIPFMASAQQYKLSDSTSKNYNPYPNQLEKITNKEGKTYWSKWMKMIMEKIWTYLKNWDVAFKNWNYSLAIKNYQMAINKLKNIRWTKELIVKIEKRIKEIQELSNKHLKIDWIRKINTIKSR